MFYELVNDRSESVGKRYPTRHDAYNAARRLLWEYRRLRLYRCGSFGTCAYVTTYER